MKTLSALIDNLRLAWGTFGLHPLRSLLTLLGVIIGVATVVTMMALIDGLQNKVSHDLAQLGANVFRVDKWPSGIHLGGTRMDWSKIAKRPDLTLEDRRVILEHCSSVRSVSASSSRMGQMLSTSEAQTQPSVMVVGATPEYIQTSGISIFGGRFLDEAEELDARTVGVIGQDVADVLFPGVEPVGQTLRLRGRVLTVIGVLERRGKWLGMFNLDNVIIVPMSTFMSFYGSKRSLSLNVQAQNSDDLETAMAEVERVLRARRRVPPEEASNFELATNESMTKTLDELSNVITLATFGMCFLSLLVGGIGILNIMLVSVTERTREIGLRKALGASRKRILAQFSIEAILLSSSGGSLGVALGYFLAFLARWAFGLTWTWVPFWAVGLSLGMSLGVGLVFGIYPAARAARLNPVEAMRAE